MDPDDPAFEDVVQFAGRLCEARERCSCGKYDLPHLDNLVSARRVAERLELDIGADLHGFWRAAEHLAREDSLRGRRARMVLEETGRLVGLALDLGVRLYDPRAILVTGTLPYNEIIWQEIQSTVETAASSRRSMVRAQDVGVKELPDDPIGPRGTAWLALDTYVYPARIEALSAPRRSVGSIEPNVTPAR